MKNTNKLWIIYAITAGLLWGIWGVVAKFISNAVTPYDNHVLFTIGMFFTAPFIVKKLGKSKPNKKGILWGIVAGTLAIIGNVAVYKAFATGGMAAVVIPATNLYPLVTILIAVLFFKEKLNAVNVIGIVLAIPAVILLSGETMVLRDPLAFFHAFKLEPWLYYSLGALIFWGVFSAVQKITTNYISAEWSYVAFILASFLIAIGLLLSANASLNYDLKNIAIGVVAGALNGLGVLASFAAYKAEGKAAQVTTIAGALQPAFTIILALIVLHEKMTLPEVIGIGLAIIGALTLSYEKPNTQTQK